MDGGVWQATVHGVAKSDTLPHYNLSFCITVAQLFATKGPDCLAHWSQTLVLTNA